MPMPGRKADDPSSSARRRETAGWVMREMQAPTGGYYSSLDADSEHEEGKFYVWSPAEVSRHTTAAEYAVVAAHYGLDQPANFEGRHWHLLVARPLADVAATLGRPAAECEDLLISAKEKLFAARGKRIRPGRDDKILTSWNALMIEGMATPAASSGATTGWPRHAARWISSGRNCGRTAACWRPARTATPT
jgi:uncharacterized protein YyaL (SSP411 family)